MSISLVLALIVGVLVASGVVLLLERSLTRVLLGAAMLGNGFNVMILTMAGESGRAPVLGQDGDGPMSDPLPQVMILTSIVITFAVTAFLLALAYRSWQLQGNDEVQDDVEDRLVAGRRIAAETEDTGADAEADAEADALDAVRETASLDDDAAIGADGGAVDPEDPEEQG
ncbi:MAG: Na(+)/H(+) antiporter subunit C [Patulibacter sp.]